MIQIDIKPKDKENQDGDDFHKLPIDFHASTALIG